TYSSRPGTAAAAMPNHIPVQVARERNEILRNFIAEKNFAFRKSFIGRRLEAITLGAKHNGRTEALTNNFVKLQIAGSHSPNQLLVFEITGLSHDGLMGIE